MNSDGWGFLGAGSSDRRLGGTDLQHNVQKRSEGQFRGPIRIVTTSSESGGPMKHHELEDRQHESQGMHDYLEDEKHRHEKAMEHHKHHIEKHYSRHYDSQHGHDTHKY